MPERIDLIEDDSAAADTPFSSTSRMTVSSDRLAHTQRWRVLVLNLVPLAGCLAAALDSVRHGVSSLNLALLVVFYTLSAIGVEVGFHRLFAHGAYSTRRWVRALLAILGSTAAQGPVTYWAGNHRRHHRFVDAHGDPHSPHLIQGRPVGLLRGLWHAQVGWLFEREITNTVTFARDHLRDRTLCLINRYYVGWVLLSCVLPALVGGLLTRSLHGAWTAFLWGGLVRVFIIQHATFAINSICHRFGSRSFDTPDHSANNPWLAIPTFGQAWHNNHHAFPTSPVCGFARWQIDLAAWVIEAMAAVGLAWDLRLPSPAAIERKRSRSTQRGTLA